jgi:hypothetical protein
MSNAERAPGTQHESGGDKSREALEQAGAERREQLRENLERSVEKNKESLETATAKALEHAKSIEKKEKSKKEVERPTVERRKHGPISRAERNASYKKTMRQVQSELPTASRTFSKFIHNPVIEKTSEAVGNTVARPNAILAGSLCAFIFTLGLYLIARNEGYPLSGAETIATFAVGWAVGLLLDYLRLEITGKKF